MSGPQLGGVCIPNTETSPGVESAEKQVINSPVKLSGTPVILDLYIGGVYSHVYL